MTLDNLHRKLFQDDGFSKMLRPDILPEHEASSGTVSILSKSARLSKAVEAGGEVETAGCGYVPGNNSLMVFRNGYKLVWGVDYEEGAIEDEGVDYATSVVLIAGADKGDVMDFVAHAGTEYEFGEPEDDWPIGEIREITDMSAMLYHNLNITGDGVVVLDMFGEESGAYGKAYSSETTHSGEPEPTPPTVEVADGAFRLIGATVNGNGEQVVYLEDGMYARVTLNDGRRFRFFSDGAGEYVGSHLFTATTTELALYGETPNGSSVYASCDVNDMGEGSITRGDIRYNTVFCERLEDADGGGSEPDEGDGTLEVGESIVYSGGEALAMSGGFIGLTETVIGDEAIGWQNGTMPNGVDSVAFYDLEGNYVKNLEAPYYKWVFSIREYHPVDEPIEDSSNTPSTLASNPVVFTTSDGRRYQIEATDDSYRTYAFGEDNPVFVLPSGNGVYIDSSAVTGDVSELACYSVKITRLEDDRKYGDLDEDIVSDEDDDVFP